MARRLAPLIAGVAGLGWFWAELAPQRAGFEDTDNPAVSLQFLAAYPGAWTQAGLFLGVAAFALIAAALAQHRDLTAPREGGPQPSIGPTFVTVVGCFGAFLFLGLAIVRLGGEPVRYVAGLDHAWGETAYLVTQFAGIHLFGVGATMLVPIWIGGVAYLGARRGAIPSALAWLALLPLFRVLVVIAGWLGLPLDGVWPRCTWRRSSPAGSG